MRARFMLLTTAALLTACATVQENPNYQYSTKYKGDAPYATQQAGTTLTTTTRPVTYVQTTPTNTQASVQNAGYYSTVTTNAAATQNASYTQLDHRCLTQETNRQLIGGAVGGTVGAVLGKKLIGGTKGTAAGAVIGGAAGYGIGDKSINCDPVQVAIPQQAATISAPYTGLSADNGQMIYASTNSTNQSYTAPTDSAMPAEITQGYGTPGYQAMMGESVSYTPAAPQAITTTVSSNAAIMPPINAPVQIASPVNASGVNSYGTANYGVSSYGYGENMHNVVQGDTVYSLSRKLCTSIEDIQQMNGLSADFGIKLGDTLRLPASRC